ncbi:MAG: Recombination protein RecR [Berkelbacteria bacterium GW2011_GWB1_38_5]|uniref:Recombination protein RecR n=2 Tax=Candidatus Berkelbacteria TaxID=1618330 RepID=A0A0G0LFS8_9BACT|nr:MAG: Recombination protein RecR [Berkelbacteria bacterium GW2011_GWB1_38_5]KKQ90708.1 MAG: Recombination protein RecR [Berkelbacteria bacterium GW2011_GWA1_39_10]
MSKILPETVQKLIEEFSKLPSIGTKTASRLVFYLLSKPQRDIADFSEAVLNLKKNLKICSSCFNITENDPCVICQNPQRDQSVIMVVEEALDVVALEKTGFKGVYHILGGVISPIDGIGPEDLRIRQILEKIKKDSIKEIILATDPSLEGEATAMYLASQIKKIDSKKIQVTRIARGLPVGGDLEYADEITLTRALEGRNEY